MFLSELRDWKFLFDTDPIQQHWNNGQSDSTTVDATKDDGRAESEEDHSEICQVTNKPVPPVRDQFVILSLHSSKELSQTHS